jgi:ubiquinone/menaquinone biosynthesis C-methylase UbiE
VSAIRTPPAQRTNGHRPRRPYGHLNAAERYIHETRDRAAFALLARHGIHTLAGLRVVELGCGEGSFVRTLLHYGAAASHVHALDIDARKVQRLRASLPGVATLQGDMASLPFDDGSFDLAFAFTSISSILDSSARGRAAAESMRVLRPGGALVIYDFWINPTNRAVRPLSARDLRALYAQRRMRIERVTLAPPIVRALGGRTALCGALERLPALRTHLIAAIVKDGAE